jgi:hypothetical protein
MQQEQNKDSEEGAGVCSRNRIRTVRKGQGYAAGTE